MMIRAYEPFRVGPFHLTVSRKGVSTSLGGRSADGSCFSATRPGGYGLETVRAPLRAPRRHTPPVSSRSQPGQ
jgi:hypothetical protein